MEALKVKVAKLESMLEALDAKCNKVCYLLHAQLEQSTAKKVLECRHKVEMTKVEVERVQSDYTSSKQMFNDIIGPSKCPSKLWEKAIPPSAY